MLKSLVGAALAWVAMCVGALAQTNSPERLVLAREVMTLSGGEASFTSLMETMRPMMVEDLRRRGVSEEVAQRFVTMFVEEFRQEAPRFMELGAIAYANAFTEEELRAMAEFLATPAGRAMVERQPDIMNAMGRAGYAIGQEVGARVAARMNAPQPHQP